MKSYPEAPAHIVDAQHPSDVPKISLGGVEIEPHSVDANIHRVGAEQGLTDVTAFEHVRIKDLWRLTKSAVTDFTDSQVGDSGRFGVGVSVGGGANTGDIIREIQNADHFRHELTFIGNALFVRADQAFDLSEVVAQVQGQLGFGPANISRYFMQQGPDNALVPGVAIHGVFFYGVTENGAKPSLEGVILHPSNSLHLEATEEVAA